MFWVLLLVAVGLATLYYRWQKQRIYKIHEELPAGHLTHYPVVGHAHHFLGSDEDRMDFFKTLAKIAVQQGGLASIWMGSRLYVIVCDPETAEVVTKACPCKDEATYKVGRLVVGNGSIFAPAHVWRPRRKILVNNFSIKNLNNAVETFEEKSKIMVASMTPRVGAGDFSLWEYIATYTFDAIYESILGTTLSLPTEHKKAGLESLQVLLQLIARRMLSQWMCPELLYERLPEYKQFHVHRELVYRLVDETIRKKRKELETRGQEGSETNGSLKKCYLELMIENSSKEGKGYSDLELREETMVLIAAGTDSTAASSCATAVMLSRYPEVQEKVFQELQEVFGNSDRPVTVEDLPKLNYLEVVIKETLRLYPPTPIVAREVHDDVKLPCGTTLVDGVSVIVNLMGLHRSPKFWGDDAEQFRPERFLEGSLRHHTQYLPFSYSVRSCLGSTYAMMSMKTVLSNLLRRYELLPRAGSGAAELRAPLRMKFDVTMKHVDGYTVRLQLRK